MRKFFSRFSRRTWIIIGGIGVILLVIIILFSGGGDQSLFETELVGRGNLTASVGATGVVRAQRSAVLVWQTSGTIERVDASVGNQVDQGQILATLDKKTLSQNIILAEADLVTAQKALEDLLNSDTARAQAARDVDAAEGAYKKAYNYRLELNGKITITEAYWDSGFLRTKSYKGYADAETISDADEKLALAEAQLEDARRIYGRLKDGPDKAEIAAAEARVAAAESTLGLASITAPFEGTVTQASSTAGDQVSVGTVGFRVDDLTHLLVDLQVSEVDINSVSIEQEAVLTFDAILGKEYHGKVVQVGQAGDTVQGVVNFTVTVELVDADELVKPGMTAAVSIVVEEIKNVILIPNRAVRVVNGERVVYLLLDGQPEMIEVRLGSSSDTMSVVVGGDIKEGDAIILNPPSMMGGPFGG